MYKDKVGYLVTKHHASIQYGGGWRIMTQNLPVLFPAVKSVEGREEADTRPAIEI